MKRSSKTCHTPRLKGRVLGISLVGRVSRKRRSRRKWSTKAIIELISRRKSLGQSLRRFQVFADDRPLVIAASKYLGNWSHALRAAGIDPNSVIPYKQWPRQAVVGAIQLRFATNAPLNSHSVQHSDPNLYMAACRRFGSWTSAANAAGVNTNLVRRQRPEWTREAIIRTIQTYAELGRPLNAQSIKPSSLLASGYRLWGSWDETLRAAGMDPELIREHRVWTKTNVIQEIALRAKKGIPINASSIQKEAGSLMAAARNFFGTWHDALRCAGFHPDEIRRCLPAWTRSRIIATLREYEKNGYPLKPRHVRPHSLRTAAKRLFGSWKAALCAAGFPNLAQYKSRYRRSRHRRASFAT